MYGRAGRGFYGGLVPVLVVLAFWACFWRFCVVHLYFRSLFVSFIVYIVGYMLIKIYKSSKNELLFSGLIACLNVWLIVPAGLYWLETAFSR